MALEAISQRTDQRVRFEAAIHGITLEAPARMARVELSEEERAAVERAAAESIARKRKELSGV